MASGNFFVCAKISAMNGIVGQWTNPAAKRCHGKKRYATMNAAEVAAVQRSHVAGELIISYQCVDCLKFHVGHPDQSQVLVRKSEIEIEDRRLQKSGYTLQMDRNRGGQRIVLSRNPEQEIRPLQPATCSICGGGISLAKMKNAAASGAITLYCSDRCKGRAWKKRSDERRGRPELSLCIGEMK